MRRLKCEADPKVQHSSALRPMASKDRIRAVFADPQLDGMDGLYQAIGEMLKDGVDFDRAYSLVVQSGTDASTTWIMFCVQSASRFSEPPEESEFLAVLEDYCRRHIGA
jgi:hypothetical protein